MPRKRSLPAGTALTVKLLSAYLAKNSVAPQAIPSLIQSARTALVAPRGLVGEPGEPVAAMPAVSARASLRSPEHIISMIDGKSYRTLRRHLTVHGLTPDSYRARYGLPADYPMVAPAYAAYRRALARQIGLGKRDRSSVPENEAAAPAASVAAPQAVRARLSIVVKAPPSAEPEEALAGGKTPGNDKGQSDESDALAPARQMMANRDLAAGRAESTVPAASPVRNEPVAPPREPPRQERAADTIASPRLTVMEAITRMRAVSAMYNGAVIQLAPHLMFERHGDLFMAALNLNKNWKTGDEKRLGQFKLAGLSAVTLLDQAFTALPGYDGTLPQPGDVEILSI